MPQFYKKVVNSWLRWINVARKSGLTAVASQAALKTAYSAGFGSCRRSAPPTRGRTGRSFSHCVRPPTASSACQHVSGTTRSDNSRPSGTRADADALKTSARRLAQLEGLRSVFASLLKIFSFFCVAK